MMCGGRQPDEDPTSRRAVCRYSPALGRVDELLGSRVLGPGESSSEAPRAADAAFAAEADELAARAAGPVRRPRTRRAPFTSAPA
jgi:hypothetical protein